MIYLNQMKNILIVIFITFLCINGYSQYKKTKRIQTIPLSKETVTCSPKTKGEIRGCFKYIQEREKDSLIYAKEYLLETSPYPENSRIVVLKYEYNSTEKNKNREEIFIKEKYFENIYGKCDTKKGYIIFTPDNLHEYPVKTFKLFYDKKKTKIAYLVDENKNKYLASNCPEPLISM